MNISTPFINTTFDFEKNYKNYKGPMTPWARVFSNSTGKSINGMVPRSNYLNKKYVPINITPIAKNFCIICFMCIFSVIIFGKNIVKTMPIIKTKRG